MTCLCINRIGGDRIWNGRPGRHKEASMHCYQTSHPRKKALTQPEGTEHDGKDLKEKSWVYFSCPSLGCPIVKTVLIPRKRTDDCLWELIHMTHEFQIHELVF
jgi:hypothetical protein